MSNLKCPICNSGDIVEKEKLFSCSEQKYNPEMKQNEGCGFVLWKNPFGSELNFADLEKLFSNETIEKQCISKAGKEYTGLFTYDFDEFKINLSFPDNGNIQETADENGIIEFSKGYKKDDIVVWKNIAGKEISKEEATELLNGGSIYKDDFKKKDGDTFSATLTLNSEENKIDMVFDN